MEYRWGKINSSCRESGSGWPRWLRWPRWPRWSRWPRWPMWEVSGCMYFPHPKVAWQYTAAPIGNTAAPLHPDLATIPYSICMGWFCMVWWSYKCVWQPYHPNPYHTTSTMYNRLHGTHLVKMNPVYTWVNLPPACVQSGQLPYMRWDFYSKYFNHVLPIVR